MRNDIEEITNQFERTKNLNNKCNFDEYLATFSDNIELMSMEKLDRESPEIWTEKSELSVYIFE